MMDTYTEPVIAKRRHRGLEKKRRIVEEGLVEGTSVALVARTHGSTPTWCSTGAGCIKQDDWEGATEPNCCRAKETPVKAARVLPLQVPSSGRLKANMTPR